MITLSAEDRAAFWARVDALGTPKARLLELHRRKAQWVKPGLIASVRHLRGEERLRHATLLSVRKAKFRPALGLSILNFYKALPWLCQAAPLPYKARANLAV